MGRRVMKTRYKFIHFKQTGEKFYLVFNNKSKCVLGKIEYFYQWRQYVFSASPLAIFSASCLDDISDFIGQLKGG